MFILKGTEVVCPHPVLNMKTDPWQQKHIQESGAPNCDTYLVDLNLALTKNNAVAVATVTEQLEQTLLETVLEKFGVLSHSS